MHLERDDVTENCRFNTERVLAYGAAAAAAGVAEIGISEHCHRFDAFRPHLRHLIEPAPVAGGWWMREQFNYSLDAYVSAVTAAAARCVKDGTQALRDAEGHPARDSAAPVDGGYEVHAEGHPARDSAATVDGGYEVHGKGHPARDSVAPPPVRIRLGLEVDYVPGRDAETRALLADHPWDYIIGSVHFLPGWAIDVDPAHGWPGRDVDQAYRDYFALLMAAAASGLFDIMAHPDLIKKFGHRPSFDLTPLYRRTAAVFAEAGVVAEVNTAGWHVPVGEAYPAPAFLAALAAAGVPISLGADAHDPAHVGRDLNRAAALARAQGYRHHTGFVRRRRRPLPLP